MAEEQIIMFTMPGCPSCHRAKQYFAEKGVPFEERSVDDAEHRRQLIEDYKSRATPTIVAGDEMIVGFDQEKIDALFASRGTAEAG